MAITLGEIAVRLTANTAEFISGFGSAGQTAKRFRADMSEHIGAVGQVLERGLAQFGEFGASVGGILGQASSAAGQAILSFGKLGGSMGTIVGVGAGVAAGLAVAEVGIIGIAIHSAEGAAKLGEMSEKAGVSSRSFAGLALAGKGVGVETESLVKALAFMGSNAVKAAISSDYAHTAFGRLGLSVKDANGHMKDGGQLFTEIVGKISSLPTSEQGFFVKAIFGRGGIEILPLINKGVDAIREKMEFAAKLGLGDPEAVASARQFKEVVDEISAEYEAMGLRLAKDLLPTLKEIVIKVSEWGQSGKLKDFIDDIAAVVRYTLTAAAAMVDLSKATSNLGLFGTAKLFTNTAKGFSQGGFSGGVDAFKKHFTDIGSGFSGAVKDFRDIADTGPSAWQVSAGHIKPKSFDADLSAKGEGKEDTTLARINDRIDALHREAESWASIAAAGSQGESLIAKATEKANAELAKQVDIADKDKTGRAQKRIAEAAATLKADVANTFYAETISKTNDEIAKETAKFIEQGKATDVLTAAFQRGGAAISSAVIESKLESERANIAKYTDALRVMREQSDLFAASKAKLGAAIGPVQGEQADPTRVAILTKAIQDENVALVEQHRILQLNANANLSSELSDQEDQAKGLKSAIDSLNASYLRGEDAIRGERIELELVRFAEAERRKGASEDAISSAIQRKRNLLQQADAQAYQGALAQEAAQFNLVVQYDNQIGRLQRIADLMRANGVSTLGVEAQIFDEQNRLIHQWDEWAFKVGTFKQKFTAVMGELVIQGRNAGSAIAGAFLQAIDGVESELAKLLTGQKANFKAVFQSLAESVTKAEIQKGAGKLAEHFGIKIPGLTAKADGSETNPFYVVMKGGAAGAAFPTSNIPLFGAPGTTPGSESSGGIGGFFSSFFSSFGGAMAGGGNMSAGNWYIAGEKGPEIVSGPGTVTPAQSFSGGNHITQNFQYGNAASRDTMRRTEKQHAARHMRNLRMSLA